MVWKSKCLIKLTAVVATAFQAYSIYKGQEFNPISYCGAISTLFLGSSAHENAERFIKDKCKAHE